MQCKPAFSLLALGALMTSLTGAHPLYLTRTEHNRSSSIRPKLSNTKLTQVQVVSERALNREWPLHLSIADRRGDSAVIDVLKGRMVIHQGASTPVMTNEPPLDWQLTNIKRSKPFGGNLAMPGDPDPASRFVRAATYLKTLSKAASVAEAVADVYAVMKNVALVRGSQDHSGGDSEDDWTTLWTTVASLDTGTFDVQLARNPYAIWVDLNKVNLGRGGAMRLLDIQPDRRNGDVTELLNRS